MKRGGGPDKGPLPHQRGTFRSNGLWSTPRMPLHSVSREGMARTATSFLGGTVKSLADLVECLLTEVGRKHGVATRRDVETLRRRAEHEGDSFITITLASYGQDLDRALADGRVAPGSFLGFARGPNGLPLFTKGFLRHVFSATGELLPNAPIGLIRDLRQIARFGSKVLLPCSQAREEAALAAYEAVDKECVPREGSPDTLGHEPPDEGAEPSSAGGDPTRDRAELWRSRLGQVYDRVAAVIVGALALDDEDGNVPVICRNGPGATVEGPSPNGKWAIREWYERLEQAGYTFLLARFGAEKTLWGDERVSIVPTYVDPVDERPAKVVLVPKTLKSPRVIAVEPVVQQFAQQGLAAVLVSAIGHGRYTSGRINFRDQGVNQEKALLGSKDGSLATVDLKDASDRVDCDLVDHLFQAAPEKFRAFLWACRSTRALLPSGRLVHLRKFASMGSALCFPVESLTFYTIVVASRLELRGLPCTPENVARCTQGVYVYGDDLIVPADETPAVCAALEAFGLKVNYRKTFWTGQFRESCGTDAFAGERVTPVYLRHLPPGKRADAQGFVGTVSTINQLHSAGYTATAHLLQAEVERVFGKLPEVPVHGPAIGVHYGSEYVPPSRWNKRYQRREYRHWVASPVMRDDPLEGEDALVKCFRLIGSKWVGRCEDHLETTAMSHAIVLKREWVAP